VYGDEWIDPRLISPAPPTGDALRLLSHGYEDLLCLAVACKSPRWTTSRQVMYDLAREYAIEVKNDHPVFTVLRSVGTMRLMEQSPNRSRMRKQILARMRAIAGQFEPGWESLPAAGCEFWTWMRSSASAEGFACDRLRSSNCPSNRICAH